MRRTWLFCAIIALCPVLAVGAWLASRARASKPAPAETTTTKLPLTRVVLFNTGLGYFEREGSVEGDTRIDLTIPAGDINDLLKTLVVEDAGGPVTISYDGPEPVDQTLGSFALDLTTNPTLGQLLNQARGEKVEVTLDGQGGARTTPVTGVIVGMEAAFESQVKEVHQLNLLTSEGVRRLPLAQVQRVRFLDPTLEDEFRRALNTLSAGRNERRRVVHLHLSGKGKRKVKIGYVAETPIWKTSYRLVLGGKGKKPALKGWAVIQNTSDEDWRNVKMVLVSGRPIKFRMDLTQALFVPRPAVVPQVYASLQPPVTPPATGRRVAGDEDRGNQGRGGFSGGFPSGANLGSVLGGQLGAQPGMEMGGHRLAGPGGLYNRYQNPEASSVQTRLTYEDLLQRRKAQLKHRADAAVRTWRIGRELAHDVDDLFVNAEKIGEGFRYALQPKVTVPRKMSALLPFLDAAIETKSSSIYDPKVHPRFPMHTVLVKNSTGQHVMQGPAAVYDNGAYVGDCRLPDMGLGDERFLSYAMDLGVEVRPSTKKWSDGIIRVSAVKGVVSMTLRVNQRTEYALFNRSARERVVVVEHRGAGWKLAPGSVKPVEKTREALRFEWKVAARETERPVVHERDERGSSLLVRTAMVSELKSLMRVPAAKPLKKPLERVVQARARQVAAMSEVNRLLEKQTEIRLEQNRCRQNLTPLQKGTDAYKRFVKKLEEQETLLEATEKQMKKAKEAAAKAVKEFEAACAAVGKE